MFPALTFSMTAATMICVRKLLKYDGQLLIRIRLDVMLEHPLFIKQISKVCTFIFIIVISGIFVTGCNLTSGRQEPTVPIEIIAPSNTTPSSNNPGRESTPGAEVSPQVTATEIPAEELAPFEPLVIAAPDCDYGGAFRMIEAVDRYTVRFELCEPDTAFLTKIAFPTFGILPEKWFETKDDGSGKLFREGVVGTGPYRVVGWNAGEELVFSAFENYWGGPQTGSSSLIFRWKLDEIERLLDLQAGVADGVDNINSFDYDTVQSDPNLVLVSREPLSMAYLGINNSEEPLNDARVRQAIAMGINRKEILETNFPNGYLLAEFFTPCVIPNGCEGDPWYSFDPLQALDLLEQSGYPHGFETVLYYREVTRGYLPRPGAVAQTIKDQLWNNLGIFVKLQVLDSDTFLDEVDSGSLPGLHLLGWGADFPDVSNFLEPHFGEGATRQFGDLYIDLVEAINQGAANYGNETRKPYYQVANNLIRAHVPAIPLTYGGWYEPESLAVAYRRSAINAHASPFGFEEFSIMRPDGNDSFVWVQSAEPLSLYCAQEADSDSLRACSQVLETLYRYKPGGVIPQPWLAEYCAPNDDLTIWDCKIREKVVFQDGSTLDANDVVQSFGVQWDAKNPFHQEIDRSFDYFRAYWGENLNAPMP